VRHSELLKTDFTEQIGGDIDNWNLRQPLGVVAGITPFNFPMVVPCWMFVMAAACGNTFVLKPSERTPSASIRYAELFLEAGVPKGVFNVVHGDKVAVDALIEHSRCGRVIFSRLDAGRRIYPQRKRKAQQARAVPTASPKVRNSRCPWPSKADPSVATPLFHPMTYTA
jgi:malonate-semialdehyde dehydrogenase (acetylating)/methylmalonate-semialdehyde dehydrogenase